MMSDAMQNMPDGKIAVPGEAQRRIAREVLENEMLVALEKEDLDGHTEIILKESKKIRDHVRLHNTWDQLREKVQLVYSGYELNGITLSGYNRYLTAARVFASFDRMRGVAGFASYFFGLTAAGLMIGLEVVDYGAKAAFINSYWRRTKMTDAFGREGDLVGRNLLLRKEIISMIPLIGQAREVRESIYPPIVRNAFRTEARALYWVSRDQYEISSLESRVIEAKVISSTDGRLVDTHALTGDTRSLHEAMMLNIKPDTE